MNPIEKNISNRYKNQELSNKGFDNEGLWNSISKEIHTPAAASSPFFTREKLWVFLKGIHVAALILGFIFFIAKTSMDNLDDISLETADNTEYIQTTAQLMNETSTTENLVTSTEMIPSDKAPPALQSNFPATTEQDAKNSEPNNIQVFKMLATTLIQASNEQPTSDEFVPDTAFENISIVPKQRQQNISNAAQLDAKNSRLENITSVVSKNESSKLLRLQSPSYSLEHNNFRSERFTHLLDNKIIPAGNGKNYVWLVTPFIGTNRLHVRHNSSNMPNVARLKTDSENATFGFSDGIQVDILFYDYWSFSSGIERHNSWTNNSFEIGQETTYYKNNYKYISIPFVFGIKSSSLKTWEYTVSAGSVLNIFNEQIGTSYSDEETLTIFDKESDKKPFNEVIFGIRGSVAGAYNLDRKFSIGLKYNINWHLHQLTTTSRTTAFGGSLTAGLTMRM